jgi:hypothetical protein
LGLLARKEKTDKTFLGEPTSDCPVRSRPTCNKQDAARSHTQVKVLLDFGASTW